MATMWRRAWTGRGDASAHPPSLGLLGCGLGALSSSDRPHPLISPLGTYPPFKPGKGFQIPILIYFFI